MNFVPLHVHSTYSFLMSALSIEKYVKTGKEYQLNALGLTDYNSLIGEVSFFSECNAQQIKPIIGLDLNVDNLLLTFIVKNEQGYQNILYLSKLFNTNKLTLLECQNHNEGLSVVIPTEINKLLTKKNELGEIKFAHYLNNYASTFKDLYIGLEIYSQEEKNKYQSLIEFLKKRDYSLLAFPLIKYEKSSDHIAYEIAQAIKNNTHLDENHEESNGKYYFRNEAEIKTLYDEESINNTCNLANKVDFNLIKQRGKLIRFCSNSDELLRDESYRLLKEKVNIDEQYKKRLDYELEVIKKMGYSDYFLIVADYIKFAKNQGIYVGHGRGSSGGSLVAYALDIITIDPIKANLLFERFLNYGRKSMPDIDCDFEDTRREEVFQYIRNKYGKDRVGNILTSQKLKAKAAIRDIGRVFNVKNSYIDILAKACGEYSSLRSAYKNLPTFRKIVDSDKYYLFIVKMASKIESFPRQQGMHAAGIIINAEPLENVMPVYIDGTDNYISQLEKDDLEKLGFLKMDLLGLRNLSIIKNVIDDVNKDQQILEYKNLPYDDKDAINLIASGKTLGLFQLESKGMIRTIIDLHPTTFEDVVSTVALFRPGPMKFRQNFINRRNGKEKVTYPSNKIIKILEPTYGILMYQEQIMQIAQTMAGFSLQEADNFRRAVSKKKVSIMDKLKNSFIQGSIKNGNSQKESEDVFDLIYRFANYGFPRAHAYAYAKLATQMAYLKYHYPSYFYCAVLDNGSHFNDVIAELRTQKINIKLPNINKSTNRYIAYDNSIYIPLISIKGILSQSVINIIKEREENGLYKSFTDFVVRNIKYKISNSTIIKLIDSGAFDEFNINRASLRNAIDQVMDYARLINNQGNQLLIDDSLIPPPHINVIEDDDIYNLNQEMESLGLTLSKSPLDLYQDQIKKIGAIKIADAKQKYSCTIVGMIKQIKKIKTKKDNKMMAFITISDNVDDISVTVFSDVYLKYEAGLYNAKIIAVQGRYNSIRNEFVANEIKIL